MRKEMKQVRDDHEVLAGQLREAQEKLEKALQEQEELEEEVWQWAGLGGTL